MDYRRYPEQKPSAHCDNNRSEKVGYFRGSWETRDPGSRYSRSELHRYPVTAIRAKRLLKDDSLLVELILRRSRTVFRGELLVKISVNNPRIIRVEIRG
jgi:hypothetical protein